MSKVLRLLVLLLAFTAPAAAQVTGPPFVFVAGTVINPDEVNSNFADVYDAALNRFGGTVEGHLLWSPDGTFDIGASGTSRPRDLFLQRDATIGGGVTANALASTGNTTVGGTLGVTGVTTLAALGGTSATFSGTVTASAALALSKSRNITTADGDQTIALNADDYLLRVTPGGTAADDGIIGFSGGTAGRQIVVCNLASLAAPAGLLFYTFDDAAATASARITRADGAASSTDAFIGNNCQLFHYDGTSSRWRTIGGV